jgi:hypothetical protein
VRLVVSLALATVGCNPIFGLDPLTGRTDADLTDADPTDAVPTCGPAIGTNPGGARVMSAVGWTLEPQAAVQLGSNRALAGVARAVDALDGLIIRRTGATTNEAWRIGGTGGELLVSAASDGASMLAVGTSRTGVPVGEPDRALLTFLPVSGAPVSYQLRHSTDNLAATAVATSPAGWVAAGRLRGTVGPPMTSAAWIGLVGPDGTIDRGIGLSIDPTHDLRPRSIVTDASRAYVVGSSSNTTALVFAYDLTTGTVPWATTLPFPAVAAALDDGQLLVGGNLGTAGMLATIAPTTGTVATVKSFANAQLHRLTSVADGALWVAGPGVGGVFAGRLTGDCLTAILHGDFVVPSAYQVPQPLVPNTTGAVLYSPRNATIVERTLDEVGSSTCAVSGFSSVGATVAATATTLVNPTTERVDATELNLTELTDLPITTTVNCR